MSGLWPPSRACCLARRLWPPVALAVEPRCTISSTKEDVSKANVERFPSRNDVIAKLHALVAETTSREEIASWASSWLRSGTAHVDDTRVWDALNSLAMADLISIDRPYLYGKDDFEAWLAELRNGAGEGED
jgi:hypothetical protein